MTSPRLIVAILIVLLALAGGAHAHPLDSGYLRVDAEGSTLGITFDLDVAVAGELLRVAPAEVDPALASRADELAARTYRTAAPTTGAAACTWGTVTATRKGQTITIAERASCPPGDLTWDLGFVKRLGATFQILGKVRAHGAEQVITIDKTHTSLAIAGADDLFGRAFSTGLAATGVLPRGWPNGLAAALLVLVLALAAPSVRLALISLGLLIAGVGVGAVVASTLVAPPAAALAIVLAAAIVAATAIAVTGRYDRAIGLLGAIAGACYGAGAANTPMLGAAAGLALGFAVLGLVVGLPLALARRSIARHVPILASVAGLGAIVLVLRAWLG